MNRLLVIGPSTSSEIIQIRQPLQNGAAYNAEIVPFNCGGQYTVAYDAAVLETDTYLITRMGFDYTANLMITEFDKVNGFLYSNNRLLKETPHHTYLYDKTGQLTSFESVSYDAHPALEDGFPVLGFDTDDYAVVNILNSAYLDRVLHNYPELHFISDNNIPNDAQLFRFEGITLDYDYFRRVSKERDIAEIVTHLLDKGVQWITVDDRGERVDLYLKDQHKVYTRAQHGDYPYGAHEVFVAMLASCLANGYDLDDAIEHGINIANDLTCEKSLSLKKDFYE